MLRPYIKEHSGSAVASDSAMQMIKGEMRLHYRTPEGSGWS